MGVFMSDAVLIAIIVGIFGTITALIGVVGIYISRSTHLLINSRMDELLRVAQIAARAEGVAAGEQSQRDRSNPPQE